MSRRNIRKLTPNIIKKIIEEERRKIISENSKRKRRKVSNRNKKNKVIVENIEKRQKVLVEKFKKLFLLKKKLQK